MSRAARRRRYRARRRWRDVVWGPSAFSAVPMFMLDNIGARTFAEFGVPADVLVPVIPPGMQLELVATRQIRSAEEAAQAFGFGSLFAWWAEHPRLGLPRCSREGCTRAAWRSGDHLCVAHAREAQEAVNAEPEK